ncbi:hypothetical protein QTP70_034558, partial [Hemibagrus guttatus]
MHQEQGGIHPFIAEAKYLTSSTELCSLMKAAEQLEEDSET